MYFGADEELLPWSFDLGGVGTLAWGYILTFGGCLRWRWRWRVISLISISQYKRAVNIMM